MGVEALTADLKLFSSSGKLSPEELVKILTRSGGGKPLSSAEAAAFVKEHVPDDGIALDKLAHKIMMPTWTSITSALMPEIKVVFDAFDLNSDGKLDKTELQTAVAAYSVPSAAVLRWCGAIRYSEAQSTEMRQLTSPPAAAPGTTRTAPPITAST